MYPVIINLHLVLHYAYQVIRKPCIAATHECNVTAGNTVFVCRVMADLGNSHDSITM